MAVNCWSWTQSGRGISLRAGRPTFVASVGPVEDDLAVADDGYFGSEHLVNRELRQSDDLIDTARFGWGEWLGESGGSDKRERRRGWSMTAP